MPRYDYQCEAGHRYEKTEPFGSPAEQPCDRCGKPARRLFGAPSIVFKGSGWYSTDSQRTLRTGVGTVRDGADGSDGGDDGDDGAEAKPAPKKKPAATKASNGKAKKTAASSEE